MARFNSNHISSLQHNLKQNMLSGAGMGGGASSVRNGGFNSNFGYQLNSESNGMMNFGEQFIASDESSFFQFNNNQNANQLGGSLEGSEKPQHRHQFGSDIQGLLGELGSSAERKPPHQSYWFIIFYNKVQQLTKGTNTKGGYMFDQNKQLIPQSQVPQAVHLRKAISKESGGSSSQSKDSKILQGGNNNISSYIVGSNKGKKPRKIFTEPNSPQTELNHQFSITQQNLEGQLQTLNQSNALHSQNQSLQNGRDGSIRLSGNKIGLSKAPISSSAGTGTLTSNQLSLSNVKAAIQKSSIKKNSIDTVPARMNHSLLEETPQLQKYGSSIDKNNSTFDHHHHSNFLYDDSRAGLLSEEKPQSFLPRLDASQRYSNSQVMYRDLDENNKSSLRERIDMSMRSPTNNWIQEGLQKINNPSKKSISSERKNAPSSNSIQANLQQSSHTNSTSVSDFNKIFKPQIKNAAVKRHSKHNSIAANSGLQAVNLKHGGGLDLNSQANQFMKEFGNDYNNQSHQLKGIGKIQPFVDLKLNEQMIRGKLNNNNRNTTNANIKNLNSGSMMEGMLNQQKSINYNPALSQANLLIQS